MYGFIYHLLCKTNSHCTAAQGKSLSLICGALRWLEDSESRDRQRVEQMLDGGAGPSTGTEIQDVDSGEKTSGSGGMLVFFPWCPLLLWLLNLPLWLKCVYTLE